MELKVNGYTTDKSQRIIQAFKYTPTVVEWTLDKTLKNLNLHLPEPGVLDTKELNWGVISRTADTPGGDIQYRRGIGTCNQDKEVCNLFSQGYKREDAYVLVKGHRKKVKSYTFDDLPLGEFEKIFYHPNAFDSETISFGGGIFTLFFDKAKDNTFWYSTDVGNEFDNAISKHLAKYFSKNIISKCINQKKITFEQAGGLDNILDKFVKIWCSGDQAPQWEEE